MLIPGGFGVTRSSPSSILLLRSAPLLRNARPKVQLPNIATPNVPPSCRWAAMLPKDAKFRNPRPWPNVGKWAIAPVVSRRPILPPLMVSRRGDFPEGRARFRGGALPRRATGGQVSSPSRGPHLPADREMRRRQVSAPPGSVPEHCKLHYRRPARFRGGALLRFERQCVAEPASP